MSRTSKSTSRTSTGLSRRTLTVWLSFFGAMTVLLGVLSIGDDGLGGSQFVAASVTEMGDEVRVDPLFQIEATLDRPRWQGIVVHHSGEPAGDASYLHRLHQSWGFHGLGYHFVIGNGDGLGDGVIQIGYRWDEQRPGAHVAGPLGPMHNEHSIAICMIGNGDRRPFTDRQMRSLVSLVRRLQGETGIDADAVHLHRELAPDLTTSPGHYFPSAQLRELIAD